VPVLKCETVDGIDPRPENRNSPLYCLIVFPDTRYAYDADAPRYYDAANNEDRPVGRLCNFDGARSVPQSVLPLVPNLAATGPDERESDATGDQPTPPRVMAPGCFGWIWLGENVSLIGDAPRQVQTPALATFAGLAASNDVMNK